MAEHCLTKLLVVGFVSLLSLAVRADDLIWYQPDNGYTGHQYAWRGTTGGNSAPELLIASFVNQPWLVTISKTKNVIYWADNRGILGTWNVSSKQQGLVYQFNIGNWDENSNGPALTGLDLDELNNHLYFTFNRSIYRLDLSQTTPAPSLIASYPNLVFNPRYSASHNSLYFCIRNNFNEQGDLVQVSLSDPSTMTTLVYNTSTGSIVQQLYIDDTTNTLYYNSPGTLTMRGVSLAAPYPQVFQSIYLGTNPTFFDFNPTTKAFVFSDLRFNRASLWSLGQGAPTTIYQPPYGRVTGVKFYNDTHALVAFQYPSAGQGYLSLVNVNNLNDTSVLVQHFGLGKSLIFDEKKCDFYYVLSQQFSGQTYQSVMRKNIRDQEPNLYANEITTSVNGMMGGIALDVSKRNLIVSSALNGFNTIAYFLIDNPNASPVQIIDSKGRSISNYVVNDKTGDIFYNSNTYIYRLDATSISKDWINNVGRQIIGPISTLYSVKMAVDSVGKKFYYSVDSSIMQSNFDGSDIKTFYTVPGKQSAIRSMKWDPSSKRLYFIAVPQSGWIMASINDDGANLISAPLNASSSSSQDLFSHISPDPHSEWVYMKAKYYQPLRISKDGSQVEILNLYSPLHYQVGSMAFDETTGSIYYNDDQCVIKKINISNVNLDDFSLDKITKGGSVVNKEKLEWFNAQHTKLLAETNMDELIEHFLPFLKERIGAVNLDHKYIGSVLKHIHEIRDAPNLRDLADRLVYFFVYPDLGEEAAVNMLEKIKAKNQIDSKDEIYSIFDAVEKELKAVGELNKDNVTKALNAAAKSLKANKSFVFLSIRWALTGKEEGLEIPFIIKILGLDQIRQRFDAAKVSLKSQDFMKKNQAFVDRLGNL